jgi:hypothetical protein
VYEEAAKDMQHELGEINPVHAYYIMCLQVKKSSQAEVQDEDKEHQL